MQNPSRAALISTGFVSDETSSTVSSRFRHLVSHFWLKSRPNDSDHFVKDLRTQGRRLSEHKCSFFPHRGAAKLPFSNLHGIQLKKKKKKTSSNLRICFISNCKLFWFTHSWVRQERHHWHARLVQREDNSSVMKYRTTRLVDWPLLLDREISFKWMCHRFEPHWSVMFEKRRYT